MTTDHQLPDAPEEIPNYVADGLKRQDIPTLQVIKAYCDELIDALDVEIDEQEIADGDDVVDVEQTGGGCIVTKMQKCGADCTCNNGKGHGPYKWKVTSDGKGGRNWEFAGKA